MWHLEYVGESERNKWSSQISFEVGCVREKKNGCMVSGGREREKERERYERISWMILRMRILRGI
jgi:hypothetical protein